GDTRRWSSRGCRYGKYPHHSIDSVEPSRKVSFGTLLRSARRSLSFASEVFGNQSGIRRSRTRRFCKSEKLRSRFVAPETSETSGGATIADFHLFDPERWNGPFRYAMEITTGC